MSDEPSMEIVTSRVRRDCVVAMVEELRRHRHWIGLKDRDFFELEDFLTDAIRRVPVSIEPLVEKDDLDTVASLICIAAHGDCGCATGDCEPCDFQRKMASMFAAIGIPMDRIAEFLRSGSLRKVP